MQLLTYESGTWRGLERTHQVHQKNFCLNLNFQFLCSFRSQKLTQFAYQFPNNIFIYKKNNALVGCSFYATFYVPAEEQTREVTSSFHGNLFVQRWAFQLVLLDLAKCFIALLTLYVMRHIVTGVKARARINHLRLGTCQCVLFDSENSSVSWNIRYRSGRGIWISSNFSP